MFAKWGHAPILLLNYPMKKKERQKLNMTENERFSEARKRVLFDEGKGKDIGRLSEKSLHRILKYYIEPNEDFHEVSFLGQVADVKNCNGVFEIQTRSAERLNPKLEKFLLHSPVTVVLPLAAEKYVSWIDINSGNLGNAHKSPKHETIFDALFELSKIKNFIKNENLHIKLIFLSVSEYRYLNGYDRSGKRGSTRCERIPNKLLREIDILNISEIKSLVLKELPSEEFTALEFKKLTKRTQRKNHYILHFLIELGVIERIGKCGRAFVYKKKDINIVIEA